MRIGLLAPSMYMSPVHFADMVFAPRSLAISLADGLVARGHDVYVFSSGDIHTKATLVPGDMRLLETEYTEEKMIGRVGNNRVKWATFYTKKRNFEAQLTSLCYAMAGRNELDIIHSYHDQLAHFFEGMHSIPTIYTLHDPLPLSPSSLDYWLFDTFKDHAYVSISDSFRYHPTLAPRFVDTVYHGVDTSSYPFVEAAAPYVLFMGRLVPEKGLHSAIEAAIATKTQLEIGSEIPEKGKESSYYTSKIQPFINSVYIREPGMVKNADKLFLYGHAKALLFPIEWEEPFGMVMIEAMACGTPVIAYNRGSVSEIVKDGVTGFIIDPPESHKQTPHHRAQRGTWTIKTNGVAGLIEAIRRVGELDRHASRSHVEQRFSVEQMVLGYERVYTQVAAGAT